MFVLVLLAATEDLLYQLPIYLPILNAYRLLCLFY